MKLQLESKGKVRDLYDIDNKYLLMITTDRISAFDVVLNECIPLKGKILTEITRFWMNKTAHIIPNHLTTDMAMEDVVGEFPDDITVSSRSLIVKKLKPILVEFVIRGYLTGSGWKDYKNTGSICGIRLEPGLKEGDKFQKPIFTPSTKAPIGLHDVNLSAPEYYQRMLGHGIDQAAAKVIENKAIELYEFAVEYAAKRGIIIADTKFEFGLDADNKVYLIDEALTPDSSRFWPADIYNGIMSDPHRGDDIKGGMPSLDKQYVRDYLESSGWDKKSHPPTLPADVILNTSRKYQEIKDLLIHD